MTVPEPATVVGGVLLRSGRVLLCHRHPDRRWYPGVWDVPGGHVEPGESEEAALVRELREELGVDAGGDALSEVARLELPGDGGLMSVRVVRRWRGDPVNACPDEHDALGWFAADELAGLALPDPVYRELLLPLLTGPTP